ncbi:hypothetical protein BD413DRAFT_609742 [Trametes elegans]|nr:hypothetical protein BD413DRAFT_609742 [Trametes elegans]
MIDPALGLLTNAKRHCSQDCKATTGMLPLLVSCLRSANLITRCSALGGLMRWTANEAEPDRQTFDPQKLIAAVQRRFPDHLADIMMHYARRAMVRCAQDHDLVALGCALSGLIQRTEFAIAEGMFQAGGPRGRRENIDLGLPFTMWTDSLPHYARALRARGTPADLDMADVLDLKFYIIRSRIRDAISFGQRAIEGSPELAYAYYAISIGSDHQQGLRAVKNGLKCKNITPFVRNYLPWRAVEHAGDLGVCTLQDAKSEGWDNAEGIAFLIQSSTGTILLTIAIKGPELSEDLSALGPARCKLNTSTEVVNTVGFTIKRTQMRLARELILDLYPRAVKEWGAFIRHFDELDSRVDQKKSLSSSRADDDLAVWLENMKLEDGADEHAHPHPHACSHPKFSLNNVALYRCTWYGANQCQKKHWPRRRVECKKS